MCLNPPILYCCIGVIQWTLIKISFISCEAAHDTPKAYVTTFEAATILITAKDILCMLGVLRKIVLTEICYWFQNQEHSPEYGL